jgi:transposase
MAFITHRKSGGKTYYYLVRSVWKNGRSCQEILDRLGTADQLLESRSDNSAKVGTSDSSDINPDFCRVYNFGAEAALFDLTERLGIVDIIDRHVNKRDQGISVGRYMQLAAINRAIAPVSKKTFFEWFKKTTLVNVFPKVSEKLLSSQSFWNHMVELDQDKITAIEDELTKLIVDKYNIPTELLLFDNTNFITYIDTSNPATIPQRGHSKEKRSDLKIIGLSLMVSPNYNIPLFHEVYPGNKCDSKQFTDIIDKLKHRSSIISDKNIDITLVFDKGNNSDNIIKLIEDDKNQSYHFVGGLRLNQCPELLEITNDQYTPLVGEEFKNASAFRTQKEVYSSLVTVLITDNPSLRDAQLVAIKANIVKCQNQLKELKDRLNLRAIGKITKGKKPTVDSVAKNVKDILSGDYMKKIFKYNIGNDTGCIDITYYIDEVSFDNIKDNYLGKTILFTNRNSWTNERIVSTYRSQFHVEEDFKQMKNIKYLSFIPVRHFTDRTIRVHAFYCVLALLLCCLLQLEMKELGHEMSINRLMSELSNSKQVLNIYLSEKMTENKVVSVYSEMSNITNDYITKYQLKKYGRQN